MRDRDGKTGVCAIVVSYNIGSAIHECVNSVRDQVSEVIIVDNGSDRATQKALDDLERLPRVKVIRNAANRGIACALNQGVREALSCGHKWMLTLDHDSVATPGMVEILVRASASARAGTAIFAANPYDRNAGTFRAQPDSFEGDQSAEVDHAICSGSLMHADLFKAVGFFNESLFVYYVDSDFSMRARRLGIKTYLCPRAVLIHSVGISSRRRLFNHWTLQIEYAKEAHYYLCRNAVYMLRRYHEFRLYKRSVRRRIATDFIKVVLYDRRKVSKLVYRFRGLWDGLRGNYGPLCR